jgi:hypothetical protein
MQNSYIVLKKFINTMNWHVHWKIKHISPSNVIPSNPSRAISSMIAVTKFWDVLYILKCSQSWKVKYNDYNIYIYVCVCVCVCACVRARAQMQKVACR